VNILGFLQNAAFGGVHVSSVVKSKSYRHVISENSNPFYFVGPRLDLERSKAVLSMSPPTHQKELLL